MLEEVKQAATAYLAVQDHRSQNSDMMFQCLCESINDKRHVKVATNPDDYIFEINGEIVQDGPCLLKAVIDTAYTNTLMDTAVASQNLGSLDAFMDDLPDSNVTELIKHVNDNLKVLKAANETIHDLPRNLFKGMRRCKDKTFKSWLQRRFEDYTQKKDSIPPDA